LSFAIYTSASFLNTAGIANISASSSVEVRRESDNGIATIYSDVNGATPLANPFTADVDGQFSFYAAGLARGYKVTVTKGANVRVLRNVQIGTAAEFDIGDAIGAILNSASISAFLTALGIAGKTAIHVAAKDITPRSANGCAVLATSNGAANQPDIPYLAFDGVVKEYAGFYRKMPKGWDEGTVTATFDWRRASGVGAANVVWGIRAVAVSDADSGAATFGADATVTDAASTTVANFNLSAETAACTIGGTPAELDLVFFEVFRDGAAGADTLDTVDAWLSGITLFITRNAVNDA
jgi:hypothetical protein